MTEKVSLPKVSVLAKGEELITKQMQANSGELLPKHKSNLESVLIVLEGECEFRLPDETITVKTGEALTVPPEVIHQIKAVSNFKAAHIMPNDIKFEYFK